MADPLANRTDIPLVNPTDAAEEFRDIAQSTERVERIAIRCMCAICCIFCTTAAIGSYYFFREDP